MAKVNVYNLKRESVGQIELSEEVFGAEVNEALIYDVLKAQLASRRAGTAKAKGRAEVSGSTRKLYRQKGTGNARHGSIRAMSFVGGGKAHGPTPRSYAYRPPSQMRAGAMRSALSLKLKEGSLTLPPELGAQRAQILELLRKVAGKLEIKNADERRQVPVRRAVLDSPEFKALWDRIKYKTTYRVHFDNDQLIRECVAAVIAAPPISKARLQWRKANMEIGQAGIVAQETGGSDLVILDEGDIELPDILTELQNRTQLTRRSIAQILVESHRLHDFKRNPQQFIEIVADAINRCKRVVLVDGIRYQRLGDDQYYAQELFEKEELTGYLKNMLQDAHRSVYQHVVYDSEVERDFADQLEKNDAIKVYAKLPGWFKVPTPLGTYNPDWAVLVTTPDGDRLYFVVETKSSLFDNDLRNAESAKIECGRAHFKALAVGEKPAIYDKFKDVAGLVERAQTLA